MADTLFKTKPVKIETLSEFLSTYRRKLNLDIKTVSMLTQIKPVYLENLERGDWSNLPADVYVKGFLKQLAEVYHVPDDALVEQYQKEHGFETTKPIVSRPKVRLNITPKTLVITTTLLLSLIAVAYVLSQVRSVLAPPSLEVSEPAGDITVDSNSIIVSGKAEIGADVFINNQAVLVDKNGQFTEGLILSSGLNVVEVKAINKFRKESQVLRRINAESLASSPQPKSVVNIVLEIGPDSAWIYVEADGVVAHRGTMLPGSSKAISAEKEILLTSANAGSTKVSYNGKDLGKIGRPNEVIRNVEFSATEVNPHTKN